MGLPNPFQNWKNCWSICAWYLLLPHDNNICKIILILELENTCAQWDHYFFKHFCFDACEYYLGRFWFVPFSQCLNTSVLLTKTKMVYITPTPLIPNLGSDPWCLGCPKRPKQTQPTCGGPKQTWLGLVWWKTALGLAGAGLVGCHFVVLSQASHQTKPTNQSQICLWVPNDAPTESSASLRKPNPSQCAECVALIYL